MEIYLVLMGYKNRRLSWLPSSKLTSTESLLTGKSPCFIGTSSINHPLSSSTCSFLEDDQSSHIDPLNFTSTGIYTSMYTYIYIYTYVFISIWNKYEHMNIWKFMALNSYSWILMSFNLLWIIWINYHSLTLSIAEPCQPISWPAFLLLTIALTSRREVIVSHSIRIRYIHNGI